MIQRILRRDSLLRILYQHFSDQILRAGGNLAPGILLQIVLTFQNHIKDAVLRGGPKRRHPGQQNVQNNTARPHVRGFTVRSSQNFRRDVIRGTDDFVKHLIFVEKRGQTKVDGANLRVVIFRLQHEILRLQISVHHPQLVAMLNRFHDRSETIRRVLLGILASLHDSIEQLSALQQLHHDVHVPGAFVRAFATHDVIVSPQVV
mmetsp:Transcript_4468/g.15422  ORF Transcript_4468/g.15422 Transcript_4468/m.15422 type:complete len:204 (-) Transcript_4468:389-1000(-)